MIKNLCIASLLTIMTITAAFATDTGSHAKTGYFYAFNDTDQEVTISVGNFVPTKYTIGAHNSKFILVSSDNQNIHIVSVK